MQVFDQEHRQVLSANTSQKAPFSHSRLFQLLKPVLFYMALVAQHSV